ncbi:TrbI/VirB10 family protein [Sphingomonas albertensis]|uniref:TrbI/VirB10 family protein n=1 Tax=Sphingomonas albertensis TaxID=2762591 RepID=A0ABR7AKY8_9SPHN|nr:TrbI/VirB10 family protein [Sphingomonas albertensis]MBC3941113.1 TrbI/VirB10 family protein [Sphingomonas albertensis]
MSDIVPDREVGEADPPARDAPPPDLRLRGDPPRVMRLSRKALAVMGTVAGVGIGGALIYALQPPSEKTAEELYNTDSRTTAEAITSAPKDYGDVPQLGPPLPGDLGRPIVSAQQRGEAVPPPPMGGPAAAPPTPAQTAAEAARQRALQERDTARTSGVFLGGQSASGRGAGSPNAGPAMGLPSLALGAPPAAPASAPAASSGSARRAFLNGDTDRRTISAERLAPPASPYVLQAGSVISAALITGLRSDLPGQITAQVTENVYDSPTGRILLVPQGSRLIADYDDQVGFGQRRVLLAWTRLILPDGRSIVLERQPTGDAAGFGGLEDKVDEHWGGLAKAAGLSTLLSFGAELGTDSDDDLVRALRQGGQTTLNQAGQEIVRRQLNVSPTLTIRAGFPVRVLVSRDLALAPWRDMQ